MADIAFPGVLTPGFGNTFVVRPIAPILTPASPLTLDYVTHTGHTIRIDGNVTIPDTIDNGFTCLVENVGSSTISIGVSGTLSLEGASQVLVGEAVMLFKTGSQAISLLVNQQNIGTAIFPPTTFENVTSDRTLLVGDDQIGLLVTSSVGIEVTLPASGTVTVGWYVLVVNNATGGNAISVEVADPATETLAGEPGGFDLLTNGESAVYTFVGTIAGRPTWQKIADGEESVIPPWPLSGTTVTQSSPLTITGGSWNQTFRETVVQGEGNITLPDLTLAPVVQGSGIRIIATGVNGLGIDTFDDFATQTIRGIDPGPPTPSPNLPLTQGQEVILVVLSTTEWGIFYQGPARPVAAPVTTLQAGVFSWAGLARNISESEIQTVLDGLTYVRSQTGIDFVSQIAEVDNIVPGNSAVADTRVDVRAADNDPLTSDFGVLESTSTAGRSGNLFARLLTSRANDEFAVVVRDVSGNIVPDPENENRPFIRRFDVVGTFTQFVGLPSDATYDVFESVTNVFIRADDSVRVEALTIDDHYTLSNRVRIRDENHEAAESKLTEASFADSVVTKLNSDDRLTATERIVLDNVDVERDDAVPAGDLNGMTAGDLLWKFGSPSHVASDYNQSDTLPPFENRTYTLAIRRPAEIARAEYDDVGVLTQRTVTPIADVLPGGFNMYTLNSGSVPLTATELVLVGGTRVVHAIRPNSLWAIGSGTLGPGEVTREDLDDDVREHLIQDDERVKLAALESFTTNNLSALDNNPNYDVHAAYFFNEPSSAPILAFPSNEAANTGDTAVTNTPALTGLTTDLNTHTGTILTGPGMAGGLTGGPAGVGFDITSSSNALDLTDSLSGIVIVVTVDPSDVTADDIIWEIAESAAGLVWTGSGFAVRVARDSGTPTSTTRTVRPVMSTPDGQERPTVPGSVAGSTTEVYFVLPSNAPTTGTTVRCEVWEYEDGVFEHAHARDFDVTDLTVDQALGNVSTNFVGNVAVQYLATYAGAGGSLRVMRATIVMPANTSNRSVEIRGSTIFTETVDVPGAVIDYDISEGFSFPFLAGGRYTVATHVFNEGGRLEYQVAINGEQGNTLILEITHIAITATARFQNPTIQVGGTTRDFTGAMQNLLVAKVRPGFHPLNREMSAISGRFAQPFYGFQSAIGSRTEVIASSIRWEGEFQTGGDITTDGVETFDLTSADVDGRPAVTRPITELDLREGNVDVYFVVEEDVSGTAHFVTLRIGDLATISASSRDGRMAFAASAATDPTSNEVLLSTSQIKVNRALLRGAFGDRTIRARIVVAFP